MVAFVYFSATCHITGIKRSQKCLFIGLLSVTVTKCLDKRQFRVQKGLFSLQFQAIVRYSRDVKAGTLSR